MKIIKKSLISGKIMEMDLPVTQEQLDRFENRRETGEYIQDIFKGLPAPEREFIMSGISPTEWSETFGS